MRWIEAVVNTAADEIDELCLRLEAQGVGGMVIEDESDFKSFLEHNRQYWDYVDEELESSFAGVSRIKFYLSDDEGGKDILAGIAAAGIETEVSLIEDGDWENSWREFYRPIEIGRRLLVVPEWENPETGGRVALRLDPGLIFGTGSHATTRMCLTAIEELSAPGMRVLDLGCGSGILGIAALLLGCESVTGCDIDPKAPEVALSNAGLNGIGADRFKIYAGDVLADAGMRRAIGGGFGLVLANIVADVIIPLAALVPAMLAKGGVFVCSGIIEGRQDEARSALEKNGLKILRAHNQEDWHCFECMKN